MITARTLLFAGCVSALLPGCGDEATEGDDDSTSSSSAASASSSGAGGASSSAGSGGSGAAGGHDTGGAGPGGTSGEISVEMTVEPQTMPAGATVQVTLAVDNFILEAPSGQPNEDGHGHFHIYLDEAKGIDYLVADQVTTVEVEIPADTTPGAHTLRVSLGENSHAPLDPPVEDVVDITVTE